MVSQAPPPTTPCPGPPSATHLLSCGHTIQVVNEILSPCLQNCSRIARYAPHHTNCTRGLCHAWLDLEGDGSPLEILTSCPAHDTSSPNSPAQNVFICMLCVHAALIEVLTPILPNAASDFRMEEGSRRVGTLLKVFNLVEESEELEGRWPDVHKRVVRMKYDEVLAARKKGGLWAVPVQVGSREQQREYRLGGLYLGSDKDR